MKIKVGNKPRSCIKLLHECDLSFKNSETILQLTPDALRKNFPRSFIILRDVFA